MKLLKPYTMPFGYLAGYKHIFVIGPQRSGTRFIAKAISNDTSRAYIDEKIFLVDSLHTFQTVLWKFASRKIVIQCPGMTRWIHDLVRDIDAVVFAWRDLDDVIESQRKHWAKDYVESLKYGQKFGSAKLKQHYWEWQQERIANAFTIRYPEDVLTHPLYVPKEHREGWEYNQTEPGL
jgi:hypothetical protein